MQFYRTSALGKPPKRNISRNCLRWAGSTRTTRASRRNSAAREGSLKCDKPRAPSRKNLIGNLLNLRVDVGSYYDKIMNIYCRRLKVKGMQELVQAYADEKLRDEKRMVNNTTLCFFAFYKD